ncbi:hypothetical protein C8A03DRAFT_13028 [Achaetomium macrosporum]|uniref:RING-type domain-containing protein n=1 Tax=Achaetomium macrosporum TaxID=79813 RepID=A0AAN7CFE9_9PEZI|nr:hypothetical protein C8A03DRAFT_13028 [Achaetomium macrosporum]
MGNNNSRSAAPEHSVSAQGKSSIPPTRGPTPGQKHRPNPSTLDVTPRRTFEPLTPPPSGKSKWQLPRDNDFVFAFNQTPPPASSDHSAALAFSPRSTIQTPLATSPNSPSLNTNKHANTFCSNCHRPILHRPILHRPILHRHYPPLLQGPSSPRKPAPNPLRCGHRLCKRCIRTSLLASLFTDPFTPASCPGCGSTTSITTTPCSSSGNSNNNQEEPVRNTTTIPLAVLGSAATAAEFLAYRDKLREMRTPAERRLYCHDREGCGMFLSSEERVVLKEGMKKGERRRAGAVVCPLCEGKTCRGCGMRSHWFGGEPKLVDDRMGRKRRRRRMRLPRVGERKKRERVGSVTVM